MMGNLSHKQTILHGLFLLSSLSLAFGLFLPMIKVSKLVLITNTFSVVSGVIELAKNGQYFLFCIIALFSVFFPIVKLICIGKYMYGAPSSRNETLLRLINHVGKWSMLDVFVVAVLVVAVKLAGLASVEMKSGLYFFAAAVIFTMLLTQNLFASLVKK